MTTPREEAVHFFNTALAVQRQDPGHAYRLFTSSVMVDQTFTEGWAAVSNANGDMGLLPASVAASRRALEAEPGNVSMMVNLGHRLYHLGKVDEARVWTERALSVEPNNPFGLCNLSLIQTTGGQTDEAVLSASRAYGIDPSPIHEFALAMALLNNEQWAEGFKHFESKFKYRLQQYQNYLNFPYPMWKGEDLTGKTLLIVAEQGLGDTLSFLRFISSCPNTGLIKLQVQPELVAFVATALVWPCPHIEVGPLEQILPQADYWVSIPSLPFALGLSDQEIIEAQSPKYPYTSLAATVPWKTPSRKLHVGIAWAGSAQNDIDKWRSFTLDHMLEFARVPGIQLYSLQVGPRASDIHACGAQSMVKDLSPYIRSVADTASIMRDLDLVITVESAPRHIAGLLGVETWVPYPHFGAGDYRCGRRRESPLWDPKTKLYRQGRDGQWPPVFERIVNDLMKRVGL